MSKTEALRLADELESGLLARLSMPSEAAAELRRLVEQVEALEADRAALLEALRQAADEPNIDRARAIADAVIRRVEAENDL